MRICRVDQTTWNFDPGITSSCERAEDSLQIAVFWFHWPYSRSFRSYFFFFPNTQPPAAPNFNTFWTNICFFFVFSFLLLDSLIFLEPGALLLVPARKFRVEGAFHSDLSDHAPYCYCSLAHSLLFSSITSCTFFLPFLVFWVISSQFI